MQPNTNANPKITFNVRSWVMTDAHVEQLKDLAKQGSSFSAAARALNVDRKTLIRGARNRGLENWLRNEFPPTANKPKTKCKLPKASVHKLYMRAATSAWR